MNQTLFPCEHANKHRRMLMRLDSKNTHLYQYRSISGPRCHYKDHISQDCGYIFLFLVLQNKTTLGKCTTQQ